MGSTSSETPPSSSARGTDQETFEKKEPNRSSTCGTEAFLFGCFKPNPKLNHDGDSDSDSDEVDKLTRSISDDMEFISKVSEKIRDYEDEIQELKRTFNALLMKAKSATDDANPAVDLAYELYFLQGKATNLKEKLSAKENEANAIRKMIDADHGFISKVSDKTRMYKETKESVAERLSNLGEHGGTVVQLRDLKKKVTKEKQRITSKQKDGSKEEEEEEEEEEEPESTRYDQSRSHVTGTVNVKGGHAALEKMPNLSKSFALAESSVFKDFEARYNDLSIELKQCLLCFSVFPENAKIKRRVMTYWWIGEGFLPPLQSQKKQNNHNNSSSKTAEDYANDFFYELIAKDFVEPSSKSSPGTASLVGVKTCKMNPFVRSMVIVLAKREKFFDFDDDMNVTSDYTSSHRACLTGKQLDFNTRDLNLLHTLFNVSEPVLAFNPDSFRRMKYVKVLYLGRWQTSSTYHVDILFLDVLKELGHAKDLRFLSLQRMSKMMELPDAILKLENLTILDIRACQNLEKIPDGIGSLLNLTHLDMSECYLLDHMPKGLSSLIKLQVLGGFVVGESNDSASADSEQCTLAGLSSMKNLRKLSIETGLQNFPSPAHLCDLNKLIELRKLTIAWARGDAPKSPATKEDGEDNKAQESTRGDAPKSPAAKEDGEDNKAQESTRGDAPKSPAAKKDGKDNKAQESTCFPWLKAAKCPWDKRNASPKENSALEPSPAAEFGKDDSAPTLAPPTKEASKDNSAPEQPPVVAEEARKDSIAPEPPLAEEAGKDNSALKPTEEIGKENSSLKPLLSAEEESRGDNSALEPEAAEEESGKNNSAPELAVAEEARRDNSASEPFPAEEIQKDNSAPELATTVEETQRDKSAPDATTTNEIGKAVEEVRKDSSTPEPPPAVEETKKDNSAPAQTGAEEIGKDNSTTKPPAVAEEVGKNNSAAEPLAAIEEDEKDNSASKATPRAEDSKECKTEQEQEPTEVKAAATVEEQGRPIVNEKHVCCPWMKALKRSPPLTKAGQTSTSINGHHKSEAKLPSKLKKLDLQCFPNNKDTNKDWLKPKNLQSLKKLYIRGGKCFDLGANSGAGDQKAEGTNQNDQKEWKVEVLCLKYLADLKMEWKELQRLFPKLRYLETVNCPKLSFFPCDENGVWMKK